MKTSLMIVVTLVAGITILSGCAPSVSVTQAGHAKQFEVTVTSNEFGAMDTQELLNEWHIQARSSCQGYDYRVVSRDILQREQQFNEVLITGIIECR